MIVCVVSYNLTELYEPKLLFMKRLFWNDIHHLFGLPVPSAYNRSTNRAASSWRTWVRYCRRCSDRSCSIIESRANLALALTSVGPAGRGSIMRVQGKVGVTGDWEIIHRQGV